uniref:Claudin 34 n=1 Tax=Stegastes partitus TaxID=144197 RepID=A0A3B5ARX8_9TELE
MLTIRVFLNVCLHKYSSNTERFLNVQFTWIVIKITAGFLAWILTMTTIGLNDWRLWEVDDVSVISSGVAWVGIWRACFHSHVLPRMENCWSIGISDTFVPIEISVAQVMMMMAVISGLAGNIIAAVAMRMVYFSVKNRRSIRLAFVAGGLLYLLTATLCLVPLVWNMTSVLNNRTIDFPPEFHLPAAPVSQKVGSAIGVGICSSVLLLISGLVFLCYRYVCTALCQKHKSQKWMNGRPALTATERW